MNVFSYSPELFVLCFDSARKTDRYITNVSQLEQSLPGGLASHERISARWLRDLLVDELTMCSVAEFRDVDFRYKSLDDLIMMYNYYKRMVYSNERINNV